MSKSKEPISSHVDIDTLIKVKKIVAERKIKGVDSISEAVRHGLRLLVEKAEGDQLKKVEVENTFKIIRSEISTVLKFTKEHNTNLSKINQKITNYFDYFGNSIISNPNDNSPPKDLYIHKEIYTPEFNKLFDNYSQINFCRKIIDCKYKQFDAFSKQIEDLKEEKRIYWITPEESFALSKCLMLELQTGDRIIAVSILGEGEWADTTYWRDYKEVQLKALEAGAKIERIFNLKDKDDLQVTSMSKFIHSNKMICYSTTDEKKIPDNLPDDIKDMFNQGFMLINKKSTNEMMAVIDHFGEDKSGKNPFETNFSYRTDVLFNVKKLTEIEGYFDNIKITLKLTK